LDKGLNGILTTEWYPVKETTNGEEFEMKCDGLKPSHRYRFSVIAVTDSGTSVPKEIEGEDITLLPGTIIWHG
jgi:hypothetical protein